MSKTRSKSTKTLKSKRAARKGSPSRQRKFQIGERIRIVDISPALKDPSYDLKSPDSREMRTGELFRLCLEREFTIRGIERYGWIELNASDDRAVRKKFGRFQTIWIEPEYLVRAKANIPNKARERKAN